MKKELNITILEKDSGKRIDALAAEVCPDISRAKWQKYGEFFCTKPGLEPGLKSKQKTKTSLGEEWKLVFCKDIAAIKPGLEPWDFPLNVLAESDSWLVIEKPEGISVHPSASDPGQETIVNALIYNFANLSQKMDGEYQRPGLVHRLDKVTSGVLLVAKTDVAHKFFQDNWKDVKKTYYAVVENKGKMVPKKGKVESGIQRDRNDRQKMMITDEEGSKDALTLFEVVQANKTYSLLKVQILTGRTHQIRVHLSGIGHPILGDTKYGGKKAERVFLHATKLDFPDPDKKDGRAVVELKPEDAFFEKV